MRTSEPAGCRPLGPASGPPLPPYLAHEAAGRPRIAGPRRAARRWLLAAALVACVGSVGQRRSGRGRGAERGPELEHALAVRARLVRLESVRQVPVHLRATTGLDGVVRPVPDDARRTGDAGTT